MHLARPVVDAEASDLAEDAFNHRVIRRAHAAQDLNAAVRDPEDGF
jgi:hypothetical protein